MACTDGSNAMHIYTWNWILVTSVLIASLRRGCQGSIRRTVFEHLLLGQRYGKNKDTRARLIKQGDRKSYFICEREGEEAV